MRSTGTQQLESSKFVLSEDYFGLFDYAGQSCRRGVTTHGGDSNPLLVCVEHAADQGACRYQHGVFGLDERIREIAHTGGPLVAWQKHHVASADFYALYDLGRRLMFKKDRLNADARCKRARYLPAHLLARL